MTPTPRRSALYIPGSNERALEKAKNLPADVLLLDLEDAVAPEAKPAARERVCALVATKAYGSREVVIRVNAPGTPWHTDDLAAVASAGPSAVLVPKVSSPATVHEVEAALPGDLPIWAMLETPAALFSAAPIAAASERLTVLVLGTNDLANELHAEAVPGRAPLITGIQLALLGGRAAGKVVLDGVYNDVKDLAGFEAECVQGRQFGFDGKTLIHPAQVEPCNRVFSPSAEQIAQSREILAAWDEAVAAGRGVATVNGRLIENLHVANARRILSRAENLGS
ncbi:CoA ester lyase [Kineosporia sp. NBRC 101731]|uniref:HpcH/HpaI aldolase/citrate lyase family protein n=1 Tax=Kineosporia sp. NBRC 101731 TaxID=3032199 RepID=UPI0024A21688|nr:CoA ester lyase [Kineosporia sp. NBRC 101731]GLY28516.1 citrate lyase subunit beta [Kineosporia sp. NBRC 101731]